MAKKLTSEAEKPAEAKVVSRGVLEGLIKSIVAKKAEAKESNGEAGKATQMCADQTGFAPKVVTLLAGLYRMEGAKRTVFVTDLLTGLNTLGFADEGTLFSSPRTQAKEAAEKKADEKAPKTDAEIGAENGKKVAAGIKQKADDDKEFDDKTSSKPSRRARSFDEPPAPPLN